MADAPILEGPRTFVSYSWSSPEHEAWVIDLASRLRESGVDVVLDKWDLREGADKYAFMEKMVTDPSVKKVVVVCDKIYAEKADGRTGGVGTETQIISHEIYSQVDPTEQRQKFVAVITEKDENGQPYVPTFLKPRIYIDMSDENARPDAFEQLVRWIYDKPLYKKPELGKPPAYLSAESAISLGTTARYQRAIDSIRQEKTGALGALTDYFETFAANLEAFRIEPEQGKELDDQVLENIELFLPYRNEAIEIFLIIGKYYGKPEGYMAIHRFFEKLLPYRSADNYRFITQELFLYSIAAMLKYERFEGVLELLDQDYFIPSGSPQIKTGMVPFSSFRSFLESLDHRNARLKLRRLSLTADLFQKRANLTEVRFDDLMQADFVLFLKADIRSINETVPRNRWWPDTLLYADKLLTPFEIFARAQSSRYFMRLRTVLGITTKSELERLLERYATGGVPVPTWSYESFNVGELMGIDRLDSRP